jgi:hypothetical protein
MNGHATKKKVVASPIAKKGRRTKDQGFIDNQAARTTTFWKRKAGMMGKAQDLVNLTDANIMVLITDNKGKRLAMYLSPRFQPVFAEGTKLGDFVVRAAKSCIAEGEEAEGEGEATAPTTATAVEETSVIADE